MAHHPVLITAPLDHLDHNILRLRRHAQMYLISPKSQHGPGPVMSPIWICDHLALVHHHNVKIFMVIEHFHGTGLADRTGHLQGLLPCYHGTGQSFCVQLVVNLQSQKP